MWLAPIALIMIAIGSLSRASQAYDYALYFAIVHAWVGIAHPRWTSVKLAPVTAAAYLSPLLFFAPDLSRATLTGVKLRERNCDTGPDRDIAEQRQPQPVPCQPQRP